MEKKSEQKSLLRVKPPKTAHINKPLVLIVFSFVILIILFAIISAFQKPKNAQTHKVAQLSAQNLTTTKSPLLKKLPKDYQDTAAIKKYLNPETPKPAIPPEVQQELNLLQQQQNELQQKLLMLTQHPQPKVRPIDDPRLEQAKTSGLFFVGSAPQSVTSETKNTSTKNYSYSGPTEKTSGHNLTEYDKQNMQSQKLDFLKTAGEIKDIYNLHGIVKPLSPYEVQAGTLIPAILITSINTSLPGEIVAQVKNDIFDTVTGRFLLIPKGSKIIGQYDSKISYGQRRVLIVFNRIIRPDGSSILLSKAGAADLQGQAGMEGDVNNHWGRILGAATLSTILSLSTGAASDNLSDNTYYRNAGQNALLGAAGNISQIGQNLTNRAINIQPTLIIPASYQFNIIVNKDMILTPFG